jgi:hypothetical protein
MVPLDVRWPRLSCGRRNIAAIAETASRSSAAVGAPPSSAWLLGLMSMAMRYAATAAGDGGLSICPA